MAILIPVAFTPAVPTSKGVTVTPVAADATHGHKFLNNGNQRFLINNASANPTTVTIPVPALVDGQAVTSVTRVVLANTIVVFGPFPSSLYNDADGYVQFGFSVDPTVTIEAING